MDTTDLRPLLESPGPFATALVDVSRDAEDGEHAQELRVREVADRLAEQGADDDLLEQVRTRLLEPVEQAAPVARLVVATPDGGVLVDHTAGFRADRATASYGPLPDLAAWIAHRDAVVDFVLVLVDHEGGTVSVQRSDVPEPDAETEIRREDPNEHKVPGGGWGHLRYQHHTENVWARNAREVVDEVRRQVRAGHHLVLLGGDPQSVALVRGELETDADTELVLLDSGTRAEDGGDEALRRAVAEALGDHVVQQRVARAHDLRQELGRGGAAVAGVRRVAEALVAGQVDTLLLADPAHTDDSTPVEELDPADHVGLPLPPGLPAGALPAVPLLVAGAVLTGARVAVGPRGAMAGEPVAALLRWSA